MSPVIMSDFTLLSFHGTFLGFDMKRRPICHRFLSEEPNFQPLILTRGIEGQLSAAEFEASAATQDWLQSTLADFSLDPGSSPGSMSLRRQSLYLTAIKGGTASVFASRCLEWESFLPLASADLAVLREILFRSWTLPGSDNPIMPADVRLGANFTLHFGVLEVDLLRELPRAEGEQIVLLPKYPDQAPVIVSRFEPKARLYYGPVRPPPKIWILPLGNTANRALQYLTAEAMREELPEAVIENVHLPEWGIYSPAQEPPPDTSARTGHDRFRIDVRGLADCLGRRVVETIVINSYTYNIDQFPRRAKAKFLLGETKTGRQAVGFGPNELVCSVRAGEILSGFHGDYFPLPPAYYQQLAEISGLDLVFFGQINDNSYLQSLREAFPNARFVSGRDPGHDFETLRRSVHIALSISTFAWLAAWLSEAETVYLPVGGMFNPVQHPDQMYLPYDDPTYRFVLLPYAKAASLYDDPSGFHRQQALLGQYCRVTTSKDIYEVWSRASTLGKGRVLVGGFDPGFYKSRYRDFTGNELEHYLRHGATERRAPMNFDERFYVDRYPEASLEVAAGLYESPLQHFMTKGCHLGYAATASSM